MGQASKDMWKVIKNDPNANSKFSENQFVYLEACKPKIEGYAWHHNTQSAPNNFQLVPESIHKATSHIGEASLSGGK